VGLFLAPRSESGAARRAANLTPESEGSATLSARMPTKSCLKTVPTHVLSSETTGTGLSEFDVTGRAS
jgi:hypothetical protein